MGFDAVHWLLHRMLSSRWRGLRALAWPHAVHHAWIDEDLEIHWDVQGRNVWCHIVPEYATQLVFTALLFVALPPAFPLVVGGLQTAVFVGVLRARGLDLNHRPVRLLDAYAPGLHTPPAYHALHHVHPDAYFSAYTKVVDVLVGGELDILVLCNASESVNAIEDFIRATRKRRLPPEVWVVHPRPDDPTARHYRRDVRVGHRTLVVPPALRTDPKQARRAARCALGRIRRGAHFVPTSPWPRGLVELRRFRRTLAQRPARAEPLRHRVDVLA